MTPVMISRMIEEDLDHNGISLSWRGRALRDCLCEPRKIRVLDASNNNHSVEVWLVFEELASANVGYKVIYSEDDGEFGLATPGDDGAPVLIGIYGGFVQTLNAM